MSPAVSDGIEPIVMPKWGLAMEEGILAAWHVAEGAAIAKGQEIADIETSKIANVFESPLAGTLRRRVAAEGETLPVGALLAVVADASVEDAALDAYIAEFQASFVPPSKEDGGPEPQTVEAGGRTIRYLTAGEGEATPILFVHGYGGDYLSWMFNQAELGADRPTYALDLPGHGGSSKDVGTGDVPFFAGAVRDFMDALGIAKAHLVGHSLGGAVVARLALDSPERAASLTLIAPAGLGPEIDRGYIDEFIATSRARKLRGTLERLVFDPKMITAEMTEEVLKFKRLDGVDAALRKVAEACFKDGRQQHVLRDELAKLPCPVRVIWGKEDRILPASHAEGLPGNVQVTLLDDCGHMPMMEKAAEVNGELA